MDNRNISIWAKIGVYALMIFFTILTIYPILWLILQSFKTSTEYVNVNKFLPPSRLYFGNYVTIWVRDNFFNYFVNSVIYATVSVAAVVFLSNMAGFAFAKLKFKITKLLHGLFIVGILLTLQSILIPLYLMAYSIGIYNTRAAVIIPYVALGLPMGVYLCTDFAKSIHDELIESAKIDGAWYLRIFTSIGLPMCLPVSITLAIVSFTGTWNEFILMSLMTRGEKLKALPYAVGRYSGSLGSDYGRLFASMAFALVPILVFYFIFRKQITKGVAAGAVKG